MSKEKDKISEKTIRKVNKIYQNYGIDPEGLDEGDINRVYKYYSIYPDELNKDLKKSEKKLLEFPEGNWVMMNVINYINKIAYTCTCVPG